MEDKKDFIRIALIGDTESGKSSLLNCLTNSDKEIKPNIGSEIITFSIQDQSILIMDTDGKEIVNPRLFSLKEENAIGVVIDNSKKFNKESFVKWLDLIEIQSKPNTLVFILINKNDLLSANDSLSELVRNTAQQNNITISLIFSCSAETRNGIKEAFEEVVKSIINGYKTQGEVQLISFTEKNFRPSSNFSLFIFINKISQHKLLSFNLLLLVITLTLIILAATYPPVGAILALGLLFPYAGSLVVSLMGLGIGLFVNAGILLNNFIINRHHSPTYTMVEDTPLTTNHDSELTPSPIRMTQIFQKPQESTTEEPEISPSFFRFT